MATGVRKGTMSTDNSPMSSQPAQKRFRPEGPRTPPSGESTIDVQVAEAFSRLEVTPKSLMRKRFRSQKRLDFSSAPTSRMQPKMQNWSNAEIQSLLMYMMLHTGGSYWVAHKDLQFWGSAGKFIQSQTQPIR